MKSWPRAILMMEVKNIFSYRFEFWMNFLGGTWASFLVAFFTWKSIFISQGISEIGGMSFRGMLIYYVIAPLITRVLDGDSMGFIAREIFDGSMNKYLIYPVDYFLYKLIVCAVRGTLYLCQLLLFLLITVLILGLPPEFNITFSSVMLFLFFVVLSMPIYFSLSAIIELLAFWADNVWSLRVFNFLMISFLGGTMVPLNLFPEWALPIIKILPFRSMIYLPTQFLLGKDWDQIPGALITLLIWGGIYALTLRVVWKRGLKVYTGVGM